MALRKPFEINGTAITPGERAIVRLVLPHQSASTPMRMPVQIIHGLREGPIMFVSAAIHGDEINGVEIIRQLVKGRRFRGLKGTLITVPTVNVYGFINHSRYLPDGRDLNRSFPGSPHGSLASRLAHRFCSEILSRCTHGIDLHTGGGHRTNHPHIRADLDDPETEAMAQAFGTPVIITYEGTRVAKASGHTYGMYHMIVGESIPTTGGRWADDFKAEAVKARSTSDSASHTESELHDQRPFT